MVGSERQKASLVSLGFSVPPKSYTQDDVFAMAGYSRKAIQSIFRNGAIERRYLAVEPHYKVEKDAEWFVRHYESWAPRLAREAAEEALSNANLNPRDVDYLVATSCTGYLCPGVSQLLASKLGLRSNVRTANLVGMGCNAAVPALQSAAEFVERNPGMRALVVSVEVSSAAYWIDDRDLESAVGNAIFSDGASAAVLQADVGGSRVVFEKFATRSKRDCVDYMGFYNEAGRLKVRLSRDIPEAVLPLAEAVVRDLLQNEKMTPADIPDWVVHPGGRRVLERVGESLGITKRLDSSWTVLRDYGNMSSATLLFVLAEQLRSQTKRAQSDGAPGIMLAMGPGLSVEGALIQIS